jgi:hypothetical protein
MVKRTLDISAVVLALLLLLGFALLAFRGLGAPQQASARFGMPVSGAAGALFYRVYLSRNLVITICGLTFLALRSWRSLAIVLTAACALPLFDMTVLLNEFGSAAPLTIHVATLLALGLTAILLWRMALISRTQGRCSR